jgi:hypothetical protein
VFHKQSKEEIATDVAFFLDGTDQSRNFYYREIIEPEDEEEQTKYKVCLSLYQLSSVNYQNRQGLFQSYVFSRTIGIHCLSTAIDGVLGPTPFSAEDPATWPSGAVTLACQSVCCRFFVHPLPFS